MLKLLKPRLLPLMIFAAGLMLSVRVGGIFKGAVDSAKDVAEKQASVSVSEAQALTEAYAQELSESPDLADMAEGEEMHLGIPSGEEDGVSQMPGFSEAELDVLQGLAERREQLDQREKELEMRFAMLKAAESQLDRKVDHLKSLQTSISKQLNQYDNKEKKKLESLVKIYSSMKPKDAARIFNELEMPILLAVFEQMKERKSAEIMAKMSSERAKALTAELAERRKIPVTRDFGGGLNPVR